MMFGVGFVLGGLLGAGPLLWLGYALYREETKENRYKKPDRGDIGMPYSHNRG